MRSDHASIISTHLFKLFWFPVTQSECVLCMCMSTHRQKEMALFPEESIMLSKITTLLRQREHLDWLSHRDLLEVGHPHADPTAARGSGLLGDKKPGCGLRLRLMAQACGCRFQVRACKGHFHTLPLQGIPPLTVTHAFFYTPRLRGKKRGG